MEAKDFDEVLKSYDEVFLSHGFKRKAKRVYMLPNNVKLQFILNKWGWTPERGAGFVIRLFDMNHTDQFGNIVGNDNDLDMKPYFLMEKGVLTKKDIQDLSKGQPKGVVEDFEEGFWYVYYDKDHLRKILDKVLPLALEEANKWSEKR